MEKIIKRIVEKCFPSLAAGTHLPIFGQVAGVREAVAAGDLCDEFRPRYAVDVQVLDEYGKADSGWELLRDVPLPVSMAGNEVGFFGFPENGAWVEIGFAYGSPNRPFIRCVLPHNLSMPEVAREEQLWQASPAAFQRADKSGSWIRKTDQSIVDESLSRLTMALDNLEKYHVSLKEVAGDDSELIGAMKKIEAFGAVLVQSGGRLDLSALDDLNLTSLADLNAVAEGDVDMSAVGDLNLSSDKNTIAGNTENSFKAPKSWVGSDAENLFAIVGELATLVSTLSTTLATHRHETDASPGIYAGVSDTASVTAFTASVTNLTGIATRLTGISA